MCLLREGSYAQKILKTLSYKIYFEENSQNDRNSYIWEYLDNPNLNIKSFVDSSKLNYFKTPQAWIDKKKKNLNTEIERILITLKNNKAADKRVKCSSYLPTLLERIDDDKKDDFIDWLKRYRDMIK